MRGGVGHAQRAGGILDSLQTGERREISRARLEGYPNGKLKEPFGRGCGLVGQGFGLAFGVGQMAINQSIARIGKHLGR